MNIVIFLGIECGRIFFVLSGTIIEQPYLGWPFLFYFPGLLCIVSGILFFVFCTDDPLDNHFLTYEEKRIIAEDKERTYDKLPTKNIQMKAKINKYVKNIKVRKLSAKLKTPWLKIVTNPNFLLAALQCTAQAWQTPVMMMGVKKFLEDVHGYSITQAVLMVTIPTNISSIVFGYIFGLAADWATKKKNQEMHCEESWSGNRHYFRFSLHADLLPALQRLRDTLHHPPHTDHWELESSGKSVGILIF